MDAVVSEEFSPEFVREALMAISQSLPDVILPSNGVSGNTAATAVVAQNGGVEEEEYRSKLISISYTESPEA